MRFLFVCLFAPLSALWISGDVPATGPQTLSGIVADHEHAPLSGVAVEALQGEKIMASALSDAQGAWRLKLAEGVYDVRFTKKGYGQLTLSNYTHKADNQDKIGVNLHPEMDVSTAERVTFNPYRHLVPLAPETRAGSPHPPKGSKKHEAPKGYIDTVVVFDPETYEEIISISYREADAGAAPAGRAERALSLSEKSCSTGSSPDTKMRTRDSHAELAMPSPKAFDGGRSAPAPALTPALTPAPAPHPVPAPRAGLLTAGEWNDLHNWNHHWVNVLADGEADQWQKLYGFYPRFRYAVRLVNESGHPVIDAPVALRDADGTILWEARTDNTGCAELWYALYDPQRKDAPTLTLTHTRDGKVRELGKVKDAGKELINVYRIAAPCRTPKSADIMWVVDATGSMGDEIEYLKTELLDVIGRVRRHNRELDLRMGTVFYRDIGDDYLTRSSKLTHRIAETVEFIRKQSAGGGGDTPEAVHSALEEAIYRQPWRDEAVARICFLVLDASPHTEPEVLESLRKTIREAARKGIRIVPLSASGIQKDTEFLMKFFGLATNGTYLFLTDHSGIGGKHLPPNADEYKVEALNDLLVRLIGEYTRTENCDGKWPLIVQDRQNQQDDATWQALYYPNPASDFFTLELPVEMEAIALYDATGKLVLRRENLSVGAHQIPVRELPPGQYTLRLLKSGYWQGARLAVLR